MAEKEKMRIVLTGGGSGGHVYPLIAVAEALQKKFQSQGAEYELSYMGPNDAYMVLFSNRGLKTFPIAAGKIRRYFSVENIVDAPKFLIGFIQALIHLYAVMPDMVFSKGGTGAFPVVLAAWFYRIPVAIHDSDAQPGMTNIASARFARKIFVAFARAASYFPAGRTIVTGLPLRAELLVERIPKQAAKEALGFDGAQPLALILGGSQGAMRINEFILGNINEFLIITQVLHQTGGGNFAEVEKLSKAALLNAPIKFKYLPVGYFQDNMATALMAADLVVARSGSSVFEFAAFALPAILIPLATSANGHQLIDAQEFAETGAGIVVEEGNLLPGIFFPQLKQIISDANLRAKMSEASAKFFIPGAAEKIADEILSM